MLRSARLMAGSRPRAEGGSAALPFEKQVSKFTPCLIFRMVRHSQRL